MNEIIEVPDIAVVKTIDDIKQLCSLRDQKIKKDTLQNFGQGSGVMCQKDLYVLDSSEIVRMTTTAKELNLLIVHEDDIEVDWGDGCREKNIFIHTYTDSLSEHEVKMYGNSTAITQIKCVNCLLTTLYIGKNTALRYLECQSNRLTSLDISQAVALPYLNCGCNQLTNLDITHNIALDSIVCFENQITTLDISKNRALLFLNCDENSLTSLDVSQNIKMVRLLCSKNQLNILDISHNTVLTEVDCSENQLTTLNTSQNIALENIYCHYNQLIDLDLSHNIDLRSLILINNTFLSDPSALTAMANSLPNRIGLDTGSLVIRNTESLNRIREICSTKNWALS